MPRLDGTGPIGMGPRTGRGMGNCQIKGNCQNQQKLGVGSGRGNGNGQGIGQGAGFKFRQGQNVSAAKINKLG